MRSDAIRRVSSVVRARDIVPEVSFPLISTRGGLPGEKNRSLIFGEIFSIAVSNSGVENGAGAVAGAAAAPAVARGAVLGKAVVFAKADVAVDMKHHPVGERLHSQLRGRKITEDTQLQDCR